MKIWMKSASRSASSLLLTGMFVLLAMGCVSTVAPVQPSSNVASWDSTNQNGGLVMIDPATHMRVITPFARDRYNTLVKEYSGKPQTAEWDLHFDAGITERADGLYNLDPQHAFYFYTMQRWHQTDKVKNLLTPSQ